MNNIEGGSISESENATLASYTPIIPSNWVFPLPATVQQALDRLAATVSSNSSNPIS